MSVGEVITFGFVLLFGLAVTAAALWVAYERYGVPFVLLFELLRPGSEKSFTPEPPNWTPEQDELVRRAIAEVMADASRFEYGWRGTCGGRDTWIYQDLTWFLIHINRRALTKEDFEKMQGGPDVEFNEDGSVRRVAGVFERLSGTGRVAMESLGRLGATGLKESGPSLKVFMPSTQTPEQFAASLDDLVYAALTLVADMPGADRVAAPELPPTGPGSRSSVGPPPSAPAA